MSKREYPFDDNLTPQLKVHVGQKQVSNGANKEQEMKKIHAERTLSLLKEGSKEFDRKLSLRPDPPKEIISSNNNGDVSKQKSALKQMILDSKMKLQATDRDIDLLQQDSCEACRTAAPLAYTRCFYCNDFKCLDCMEECVKCQENFCRKCSLVVYDDGEHTECLACYR